MSVAEKRKTETDRKKNRAARDVQSRPCRWRFGLKCFEYLHRWTNALLVVRLQLHHDFHSPSPSPETGRKSCLYTKARGGGVDAMSRVATFGAWKGIFHICRIAELTAQKQYSAVHTVHFLTRSACRQDLCVAFHADAGDTLTTRMEASSECICRSSCLEVCLLSGPLFLPYRSRVARFPIG